MQAERERERERCCGMERASHSLSRGICGKQGLSGAAHLDQMWCVLSVQLVLWQLVPVDYPRVSEHKGSSQSLMRVHMEHLGHQVL